MVDATSNRSVYQASGQKENTTGIARRVSDITVSAIKQMPLLASKIGGCVTLGQGIPSFNTPEFIRDAVIEELRSNPNIGKYTIQPGVGELKQQIAIDLKRTKHVEGINADTEIFVSCGAMEALAAGLATIIERGDEVLLPTPTYASHIEQILFAEGVPVFVPLEEEQGWKLDIDRFAAAITRKTKAIVICSPSNPTGTTFSEADLRAIGELAIKHNLFIVMDEAYDFLLYTGEPYFSLMSVPELKDRLLTACSFSKRYCMTGWRVGYMYASERIIQQVLKVHDAFAICAPTISQYAALVALRNTNGKDGPGDRSIKELCEAFNRRRSLVLERLDKLSDYFSYVAPQGGYYVFPKYTIKGSSIEVALRLLNEAKVITIPGGAFGPTGEGHIRLSFGAAEEELNEAFDRLDRWAKSN